MEEIVQELQKISEILLQNQTPAWLTYLSSLGPLILTGISVFIACGQHKQNQNSHRPNISSVISGYKQPSKSAQSIEITGFIEKSKPSQIIFLYTLLPLTA